MPLLPFDSFSIDTPLSASEAAARLANVVEPRRLLRLGGGEKPFEGVVSGDSFAIRRVIGYRNSFLPEIRGRIEATASGSRVRGTMRLHPLVLVFMALWVGFAAMLTIMALSGLQDPGEDGPPIGGALALLLFGWALVTLPFTIEARIARGRLAALLAESA